MRFMGEMCFVGGALHIIVGLEFKRKKKKKNSYRKVNGLWSGTRRKWTQPTKPLGHMNTRATSRIGQIKYNV